MQTSESLAPISAPDGCTVYRPLAADPTPDELADWCAPKPTPPFAWLAPYHAGTTEEVGLAA